MGFLSLFSICFTPEAGLSNRAAWSALVSQGNTGRSMLSGQRTRKRVPWGLNKRGPLEPQSMEEISERKGIGKFEPLILYVNLRSSRTMQMQNRIKKRKA